MVLFRSVKHAGFTMIELLVVIAILGVLAAGIIYGMDPVDRINSANDVKVQNALSEIGRAADAYSLRNNGAYPDSIDDIVTGGELKSNPSPPSGYGASYNYVATASGGDPCTTEAGDCEIIIVTSPLKSRKYQATPYQRVEVTSYKICQVVSPTDACP